MNILPCLALLLHCSSTPQLQRSITASAIARFHLEQRSNGVMNLRSSEQPGGVAERLIAPVLKTGRPKGLVSSNLTPSAPLISRHLQQLPHREKQPLGGIQCCAPRQSQEASRRLLSQTSRRLLSNKSLAYRGSINSCSLRCTIRIHPSRIEYTAATRLHLLDRRTAICMILPRNRTHPYNRICTQPKSLPMTS